MSEETRCCEFCRDRLEEFSQCGVVCGACEDTRVLGIKDCFCHAHATGACGCDADWSDYIEFDYWEED